MPDQMNIMNRLRGADPKVSFITVCYRTPGLIRLLLRGVEAANLQFPFEYFLVDSAPGDGTSAMVRERFPWVQIIETSRNVGFGSGNNLALKRARGDYVMVINPDLTIFSNELEKLVYFMDDHPDVAFAGPALFNPDGTRQDSYYRFISPLILLYRWTFLGRTSWGRRAVYYYLMRDIRPVTQPMEADVLMFSAIMMRRKALHEIGLFDERFFMYFEEMDICRRAWERQWRVVYVPQSKLCRYYQRESRIDRPWHLITNRSARAHIISALYYFRKYWYKNYPHRQTRPIE